jgi:methylenetetrahydrofolate reductase (NADPH)
MCGASIPHQLSELILKYGDSPEDSRKAGMEFTIGQCRNLMENDVRYFHFYTLNRWEAVSEIIKQLKIKEKGTHR